MFFQVYGANALAQWGMLLVVLVGLILFNEFARRTKAGGIITFFVIPVILTVYFVAIAIGARAGADWAVNNQTHVYMNGWFHYAKLYAALTGCIGFMMIKYKWGIGAKHWFKPFPFIIVAINILIAVASDFESAIMGWNKWWLSSEGVWLYGGWHNVMNGVAGLLNILCMTAWWNVFPSKDKKDMIWADMTWVFIVVYDIWNFAYTYNCLPTHSWFCGIALLLAPTIAAKDGFQAFKWAVLPVQYPNGIETITEIYAAAGGEAAAVGTTVETVAGNPTMMTVISALALITNAVALCYIIAQAKKRHINPYKEDVFINQKYYKDAMERADLA